MKHFWCISSPDFAALKAEAEARNEGG